jgi:hypothetical protein
MAITISTVSPLDLPANGGTTIRVIGTNLNTVTGVTFKGVSVAAFTKVNNTTLEFGSPELASGDNLAAALILTDGTTPVTKNVTINVLANGLSPEMTKHINAYHSGTVYTSFTGEKAPWVRQAEIMELVENDGTPAPEPLGVDAPLFDDTNII